MRLLRLRLFAVCFAAIALSGLLRAQEVKPGEVKEIMQKVADWQIEHINDLYSGSKVPHHPLNWTKGALYVGMVKWAAMADDDRYYTWLKSIGDEHGWVLHKRQYHADDHTVGQMYGIDAYANIKMRKCSNQSRNSLVL